FHHEKICQPANSLYKPMYDAAVLLHENLLEFSKPNWISRSRPARSFKQERIVSLMFSTERGSKYTAPAPATSGIDPLFEQAIATPAFCASSKGNPKPS